MATKKGNDIHRENSALTGQFQRRTYENRSPVDTDTTQTSTWAVLSAH